MGARGSPGPTHAPQGTGDEQRYRLRISASRG
jgi:hypothetical protein